MRASDRRKNRKTNGIRFLFQGRTSSSSEGIGGIQSAPTQEKTFLLSQSLRLRNRSAGHNTIELLRDCDVVMSDFEQLPEAPHHMIYMNINEFELTSHTRVRKSRDSPSKQSSGFLDEVSDTPRPRHLPSSSFRYIAR